MTNVDYPTQPGPPKSKSNCFVVGGVTCLVLLVVFVLIAIWAFRAMVHNPAFKQAFTGVKLATECQLHLQSTSGDQDIYHALDRYKTRYGKYPQKLDELYPTFLKDRSVLHCPADTRPNDVISYEYTPPAVNASGTTVVVECKRHVLQEGQPPLVLKLCKNGEILRQGFTPHGSPAEPKTGE